MWQIFEIAKEKAKIELKIIKLRVIKVVKRKNVNRHGTVGSARSVLRLANSDNGNHQHSATHSESCEYQKSILCLRNCEMFSGNRALREKNLFLMWFHVYNSSSRRDIWKHQFAWPAFEMKRGKNTNDPQKRYRFCSNGDHVMNGKTFQKSGVGINVPSCSLLISLCCLLLFFLCARSWCPRLDIFG